MTVRTSRLLVGAVGVLAVASVAVTLWLNHLGGTPRTRLVGSPTCGLVVVVVIALSSTSSSGRWWRSPVATTPWAGCSSRSALVLLLGLRWTATSSTARALTGRPPGHPSGRRARERDVDALVHARRPDPAAHPDRAIPVPAVAVGGLGAVGRAGLRAFLLAIPSEKTLDPPYQHIQNPMEVGAIQPCGGPAGHRLRLHDRARADRQRDLVAAAVPPGRAATSADSCSGWSSRSHPLPAVRGAWPSSASHNGAGLGHRRRHRRLHHPGADRRRALGAALPALRRRADRRGHRHLGAAHDHPGGDLRLMVWLGARAVRPGRSPRHWPPRSAPWPRPAWPSRCAGRSRTRWTGVSTGARTTRAG